MENNLYRHFKAALPCDQFLAKFGSDADRRRWQRVAEKVTITPDQKKLLQLFRRETHVLVLAGAWCGDCARQCPVFDHFAAVAPVLKVRYLDRDERADAQLELSINGGRRVPVVVFFSEDGFEVARYGDRTLSAYRRLVAEQGGETCASGHVGENDSAFIETIQDWLDEFERVQWILRLSPRLRQTHND